MMQRVCAGNVSKESVQNDPMIIAYIELCILYQDVQQVISGLLE